MSNNDDQKQLWLNEDFLQNVIQKDLSINDNIEIIEFSYKPAVKNGENFSSNLYRVKVSFRLKSNVINEVSKRSYIVKVMFDPTSGPGENLRLLNVFKKEVTMYSSTLFEAKELLSSIGADSDIMPRLLYWSDSPQELLVLEDLKPLGYQSPSRRNGLDVTHCRLVLTKLAGLHATSMLMNRKKPEFRELYNLGGFFEGMPDYLSNYYTNGVRQATEVMHNLPDCNKYVKTFEEYANVMVERGIELLKKVPHDVEDFNVLNHGDFWLVNMLFKYNETGTPIDVKFVDFQMSTFGNPGFDLNYFFFTSPTDDTRSNHRDELLQTYQTTLADILVKLKYDRLIPTISDLHRKLMESKDIGIMTPCIVLPIVKLDEDSSKTISTEKLMESNNDESSHGLYDNPLYHSALNVAVQYLADIGFIDKIN